VYSISCKCSVSRKYISSAGAVSGRQVRRRRERATVSPVAYPRRRGIYSHVMHAIFTPRILCQDIKLMCTYCTEYRGCKRSRCSSARATAACRSNGCLFPSRRSRSPRGAALAGSRFTCFTSTKVQILTQQRTEISSSVGTLRTASLQSFSRCRILLFACPHTAMCPHTAI
jgi:hypothetical protein